MLAVCNVNNDEKQGEMESFSIGQEQQNQFPDFSDDNLLDCIDFDDIFAGINEEDVLPDLEMDPEILAEFSTCSTTTTAGGNVELSEMNYSSGSMEEIHENCAVRKEEDGKAFSGSDSSVNDFCKFSSGKGEEESVSKREESAVTDNQSSKDAAHKGRKSSSRQSKNSQGKRKVKVDWTPELHRKFVQAVEQLGIDKAVPSRILELMGIDCLTRHNVASHLQKYRSHRKHMLAREAEAASWNQKRQRYGGAATAVDGNGKRGVVNHWLAPTMGFPPLTPMHHLIRPLHVWGHPSVDQSLMHIWPIHLPHSASQPTSTWQPVAPAPPPPPPDSSYWHPHHQRAPSTLGAPCFPQPVATPTRFTGPPVPGFPPHAMYNVDPGLGGVPAGQSDPRPLLDFHPSKESVDAAIGDVLSKPWLPLPIGLKPPAVDCVLGELQRQGVSKLPPNRA